MKWGKTYKCKINAVFTLKRNYIFMCDLTLPCRYKNMCRLRKLYVYRSLHFVSQIRCLN